MIKRLLAVGILSLAFVVPSFASATCHTRTTPPGQQPAVICSEPSEKPVKEQAADAKDLKAKIGSKSTCTNEKVVAQPDGKFEIESTCGVAGKRGQICMKLLDGKEVCTAKPDKNDDRAAAVEALTKGPQGLKEYGKKTLADALKNAPRGQLIKALDNDKVQEEMYRLLTGAGLDGQYVPQVIAGMQKPENEKSTEDFLRALASGDTAGVQRGAADLKNKIYEQAREIAGDSVPRSWLPTIDAQKFARDAVNSFGTPEKVMSALPDDVREQVLASSDAWCSYSGGQCAVTSTGFERTSSADIPEGFTGGPVGTPYRPAEPTRITVDQGGKVDPVTFYKRALEEVERSGLVGYVDPTLAMHGLITTGSKEEWARLFTLMAKQESNYSIWAAGRGECSYGILQYCPGEYGLGGMSDVRNPESALQAVIRTTQQGKLFQYFGPLKRLGSTNEITKHANWFNTQVAPYADGSIPYTPIGSPYVASGPPGLGNIFGGYQSPGSMYGDPFGYGSDYGNGSGSGGGLGGILGSLGGLLGNLFGTNQQQQQPKPPTTGATPGSPTGPKPPEPPTGGGLAQVPPSIALAVSKKQAARGETVRASWATTGTGSCGLFVDGAQRADGKSGTAQVAIAENFSGSKITIKLECTASDPRISSRPSAVREVTIQ